MHDASRVADYDVRWALDDGRWMVDDGDDFDMDEDDSLAHYDALRLMRRTRRLMVTMPMMMMIKVLR